MGYEPLMDSSPSTNVYNEHVFKARVTLGAGTVSTIRCKDMLVTRPTASTIVLTLPKAYAEITDFYVGQKAAASTIPLAYVITTNAVATTGIVTLTSLETAAAGTATAGADGDVLYITLGVSCDMLNDRFTDSTA